MVVNGYYWIKFCFSLVLARMSLKLQTAEAIAVICHHVRLELSFYFVKCYTQSPFITINK